MQHRSVFPEKKRLNVLQNIKCFYATHANVLSSLILVLFCLNICYIFTFSQNHYKFFYNDLEVV